MGLGDAFNDTIEGLLYLAILGGFVVGMWPTLVSTFGNYEVYGVWGQLILSVIALIIVVFAVAIIQRIYKQTQKERDGVSKFLGRREDDDFQ